MRGMSTRNSGARSVRAEELKKLGEGSKASTWFRVQGFRVCYEP